MTELQILNAAKNSRGHIAFSKLLDLDLTEDQPSPSSDKALIKRLISEGLLHGFVSSFGTLNITEKGLLRLSELQQLQQANQEAHEKSAKQNAEQKAQNRKEKSFQIYLAFIGTLFGALFSNLDRIVTVCTQIWELIMSLF